MRPDSIWIRPDSALNQGLNQTWFTHFDYRWIGNKGISIITSGPLEPNNIFFTTFFSQKGINFQIWPTRNNIFLLNKKIGFQKKDIILSRFLFLWSQIIPFQTKIPFQIRKVLLKSQNPFPKRKSRKVIPGKVISLIIQPRREQIVPENNNFFSQKVIIFQIWPTKNNNFFFQPKVIPFKS